MKNHRLRIGKIYYANLFPIFYMLEKECDCSGYEFVEGVPSSLNKMLRAGEIDVSPSSSIEYLKYVDKYNFVDGHSISSAGPVGSIILFSKKPIEALDGETVLTSSQSDTSVALLEIILTKFINVKCNLRSADFSEPSSDAGACLMIGDDALKAVKRYELKVKKLFHIYDLGDLWHKHTGLPFTFALWIYRKGCCDEKGDLLERFTADLNKARKLAIKNFDKIAASSPLKNILTEKELVSYWKNISYDFSDEHKKGLELFRKYCEELGLLLSSKT